MKKLYVFLFSVAIAFTTKVNPSPLHEAVKKNNITSLISLIDTQKYNVNEFDEEGFTPLHYAALLGYLACTHVLVDNGKADIDLIVEHGPYVGNSAKRLAQRAKKTDIVSFLKAKKMQESFDNCDCLGLIAWVIS
ncbi:ankyrin repeat domain-containing protein [bacterium]|nr:MAG: ankyrin repeat domain-containing protein [bacterium]